MARFKLILRWGQRTGTGSAPRTRSLDRGMPRCSKHNCRVYNSPQHATDKPFKLILRWGQRRLYLLMRVVDIGVDLFFGDCSGSRARSETPLGTWDPHSLPSAPSPSPSRCTWFSCAGCRGGPSSFCRTGRVCGSVFDCTKPAHIHLGNFGGDWGVFGAPAKRGQTQNTTVDTAKKGR